MAHLILADADDLFVSHKDVWEGVKDYYKKFREAPSVEVLQGRFRDFEPTPVDAPTGYYLEKLQNEHLAGKIREVLLKAGSDLKDVPPEKIIQNMQSEISTLTKYSHSVRDVDVTDWQSAEKHIEAVRERSDLMGGSPGIKTGFASVDTAYATGMAPGHYIVTIGYPSRGKTWFTSYLAVKAWEQGFKPMIVSLEMSPEDMRNRIYGLMGSGLFRVSDFQQGSIDVDQFRSWGKKTLDDKQEFIIVSNDGMGEVTPSVIQAKIDQHQPDIVICDYMQLMSDNRKSDSLTPRMMNLSRELKLLAVTNNIPVIAISAVTMDDTGSQDDPPTLSQVAWSKAIEYDADMAMSVHRHANTDIIEVVSRKNRHGTEFGVYLNIDLNRGIIEENFGNMDDT
jgi:replicative DNA helicase